MPARRLRWTELFPGLLACAAVIALAGGILVFGGIGALHGDTVRYYVATSQARGLIRGSDVWLQGQRIGKVLGIRFRPPSVDTSARLLIELEVLERHQPLIRRDSYAQIRAGGTLIGQPVMYLSGGTSRAPMLESGDTIQSMVQPDFEGVTSQVALASRHFPAIIENVKLMNRQLESARGTLGALGLDENRREIHVLRESAGRLAERALESDGSLAQSLRHGGLMDRGRIVIARADSIRELLSGAQQRVGRFRRDSTLARDIADLRNEVSIVRARLAAAAGTAGRVSADSAIVRELAALEKSLSDIIADVKRDPMRYLHFDD